MRRFEPVLCLSLKAPLADTVLILIEETHFRAIDWIENDIINNQWIQRMITIIVQVRISPKMSFAEYNTRAIIKFSC